MSIRSCALFGRKALSIAAISFGCLLSPVAALAAPATLSHPTASAPELEAKSYILIEADTGQVLAQHNGDTSYPPASLTKMMTNYIVASELASGRIRKDDDVPVSVKAWRTKGSRMFIREGTTVTLDDLMHGSIIQSGNDASVAMAEYISGSVEGFADLMNQQAKRLGMKNSHFVNPTGLPAKHHHASAHDLAILGRAIVRDYPEEYKIYGQESFTYNGITQYTRNKLVRNDNTVDGMKTGWTVEAGYCMVSSALRQNMRLIAVVMGAKTPEARVKEMQELLSYGYRYFEKQIAVEANAALLEKPLWYGRQDNVKLGVADTLTYVLPKNINNHVTHEITVNEVLDAPVAVGDALGTVAIKVNGEVRDTVPLIALESVEQAGFIKCLIDRIKRLFVWLF